MMLSTSTPGPRRPSHTARPLPAARAAVPARTEAPVALDVVATLLGLLALLRQLATLTVVDVLTQWSGGGYDWNLILHPDVVSPWIGVARPGCTILFAVGDRDLRALSQQGVTVNSPAIVEQLSAPRPREVGTLRLSLVSTLVATIMAGRAYRPADAIGAIGFGFDDGAWEAAVSIDDVAAVLNALTTRGVDLGAEVWIYERASECGPEVVFDGAGWFATVEALPLVEVPPADRVLYLPLPRAEGELRAEDWPTLPIGEVSGVFPVAGEVG